MNFLPKLFSLVSWNLPTICADAYSSADREEVTLNSHITRSNQWIKKLRLFYLGLENNNEITTKQNQPKIRICSIT